MSILLKIGPCKYSKTRHVHTHSHTHTETHTLPVHIINNPSPPSPSRIKYSLWYKNTWKKRCKKKKRKSAFFGCGCFHRPSIIRLFVPTSKVQKSQPSLPHRKRPWWTSFRDLMTLGRCHCSGERRGESKDFGSLITPASGLLWCHMSYSVMKWGIGVRIISCLVWFLHCVSQSEVLNIIAGWKKQRNVVEETQVWWDHLLGNYMLIADSFWDWNVRVHPKETHYCLK